MEDENKAEGRPINLASLDLSQDEDLKRDILFMYDELKTTEEKLAAIAMITALIKQHSE